MIRRQIEEGFDVIAAVDAEIRGALWARNWPHLAVQASAEGINQSGAQSGP
jgi:hypothetical protein